MNAPLQLDDIKGRLGQAKLEAERLTSGLDEAQLWQRPPDGGWSVGECLVHLNLAGEPYVSKLRTALAEAKAKGRSGQGPFELGFLGGRFVRSLSAEAKTTFKSPKAWWPEPQPDVLARFVGLQADLLELTHQATGFDLARVTLTSPLSPLIRLSLFEALNLLVVHQERHFAQAERVREGLTQNR